MDQSDPNVEGVYETQVPLIFRAFVQMGCMCRVICRTNNTESFNLEYLEMVKASQRSYLPSGTVKHLYLYQHRAESGTRQFIALFLTPLKKALVIVHDSVRTNLMPNLQKLYRVEWLSEKEENDECELPPEDITFEIHIENNLKQVYKLLQKALQSYKDEKKGPTLLSLQIQDNIVKLQSQVPALIEFPQTHIYVKVRFN